MLYDFENFNQIQIETPLSIKKLAILALNDTEESGWCEEDGPIDELAETVKDTLVQKAPILKEYYGLIISNDGLLHSLPLILGNSHFYPTAVQITKINIFIFQMILCLQWFICRCTSYAW